MIKMRREGDITTHAFYCDYCGKKLESKSDVVLWADIPKDNGSIECFHACQGDCHTIIEDNENADSWQHLHTHIKFLAANSNVTPEDIEQG